MQFIFLYGPPAAGKLTIGRLVAERTGFALFHNQLIVDAVAAVFAFGSPEFIRLREQFWLETIAAATRSGRSLIFTFAPDSSVREGLPEQVMRLVEEAGGTVLTVALHVDDADQDRRLVDAERARFGKLRSVDLLSDLRSGMKTCMAAMPTAALSIDTSRMSPAEAATAITRLLPPG
jgi:hypothetical protein